MINIIQFNRFAWNHDLIVILIPLHKADNIRECVIADIIVFLVAYLIKEPPIVYAGLLLLIVIIYGLYKRIKQELYW